MIILEILFWFFLFIVFYSYIGYGILITIISKVSFLKKILPRPYNSIKHELFVSQNEEFYPTVSMIISASGETSEIIREKIVNTLNLDYPKNKLEVIFAVAFEQGVNNDETINEYYDNFLEEINLKDITSKDEEVYINFMQFEEADKTKEEFLDELTKKLETSGFSSEGITLGAKSKIDNMFKGEGNNELRVYVTKDIERKGKISQVNRTVKTASGEILVFSDANAMFNKESLINLTKHFRDKAVACVAGEKRVKTNIKSTSGEGEGLYWKYESYLKKLDSDIYSAVGAAGEIFAVRKDLWGEGAQHNAIIEDFVLSMQLTEKGYRVVYEPDAYAEEDPTLNIQSEYKRRVRIAAGGFQSINWLRPLLNPFRFGVLSFQYISHRVLRWAVVPFLLPIIFVLNLILAYNNSLFYTYILLLQIVFYVLAITGYFFERRKIKIKIFYLPFVLTMMNIAAFSGYIRYKKGRQDVVWEKVKRV